MKKISFNISILAAFILAFTSCKNDLDVLAPGKESVSVYGILNPNEAVQNIRINKVYITDNDALVAGQDANQINYDAGELEVSLERYVNGKQISVISPTLYISDTTKPNSPNRKIVLTETVTNTLPGLFNNEQRIWQTSKKIFKNCDYKLIIKNLKTGAEFTAQTNIIDSVKTTNSYPTMPFYWNTTYYPMHGQYIPATQPGAYINYESLTQTYPIKFRSVANAKRYHVSIKLHYYNYSTLAATTPNDSNFVTIDFPTLTTSDTKADNSLHFSFTVNEYFNNIGGAFKSVNSTGVVKRKVNYIEYIIHATTENMSDFLLVNEPSNSIAQDKPSYTNINGGVGIFACVSKSWVTKDFTIGTKTLFSTHPSTSPYLFQ